MKKIVIVFFVFTSLSFGCGYLLGWNEGLKANPPNPELVPHSISFNNENIWLLINKYRVSKNLAPFIKDQSLCSIAESRLPELKNELESPHAGFNARFASSTYPIAENNTGAYSDQNALDRWLGSAPHRTQLESDWKYSCVVCSEKELACVQIFTNF